MHLKCINRKSIVSVLVAWLISLCGCAPSPSPQQRHDDANTPAGKVGQAAHKAAVEADRAGRVIGKKLGKAAHDAKEGWKEAARSDSNSKK